MKVFQPVPYVFTTASVWILVLFGLVACNDFLDDLSPGNALPLSSGLDNAEAIEDFLVGAYDVLQNHADILMIGLVDIMTEDTGKGVQCGEGSGVGEFCVNDIAPGNDWLQWIGPYTVINHANIIIGRVNQLLTQGSIDPGTAAIFLGEAHFLRGVEYFELIRLYALPLHTGDTLGVPLLTTGVDNTDKLTFPARATVEDVYAQIRSDFRAAMELLPRTQGETGRASYYAAAGYLAEVAFQTGDYAQADSLATIIVSSGKYTLTPTPADYFGMKGSQEEIWAVAHSNQERGQLWNFTQSGFTWRYNLSIDLYTRAYGKIITSAQSASLASQSLHAEDLRFSTLTDRDTTNLGCTKYPDRGTDVPALRYAEVLLMRAECRARLGDTATAIEHLNQVRKRAISIADDAGNPLSLEDEDNPVLFKAEDFTSPDSLIEAIILERQVELIMEGNRFHDLIRLERPVNGLPYDHCKLRWPIPLTEMDVNPNLVQNPDC